MFEIEMEGSVPAHDPDLSKQLKPNRPAVAPPTGVPNRHTTFVPSENTTFSLGEKCKDRINDVGITGRTDNHVHFYVAKNNKTIVSLGGPATEYQDSSDYPLHDCDVPTQSKGYAMVTDQHAWHESDGQHYLVSKNHDIVVRTVAPFSKKGEGGKEGEEGKALGASKEPKKPVPTALLQSDEGNTTIGAGEVVTVGAKKNVKIFAHTKLPLETAQAYAEPVTGQMNKEFDGALAQGATSVLDKLQTFYGIIAGAVKLSGEGPALHKPEAKSVNYKDIPALVLDGGKLITETYEALNPEESEGNIELIAEEELAGFASKVSMFGTWGVGISSAFTVDIVSATVGLKAGVYGGIWSGVNTSVKAGMDVTVEAEFGETKIAAKKDVIVFSEHANVIVAAHETAQLNSITGGAMVHGVKTVYCGAGKGDGYGVYGDAPAKRAFLGKFSAADTFDKPAFVKKEGVLVSESSIRTQFKKTLFRATESEALIEADKIKLDAKNDDVTVKGKRVMLG